MLLGATTGGRPSKPHRHLLSTVATVLVTLLTVGACAEGPKVPATAGDTEPAPSPAPHTEVADSELARPTSTSAPSTTVQPTDPGNEPEKDPADTTPVVDEDMEEAESADTENEDEDAGDEDEDADDADDDDQPDGDTDGDADPEDDNENDDSSGGGVNDSDLSGLGEHAQTSVTYVNERRAEEGLNALTVDADLTAMADRWARQMIAEQDLHHNPNLSDEKPDRFTMAGENIAFHYDPTSIDEMWWNSDGHRANILGSDYTHIGVAFVLDEEGTTWAVQVFGA